MRVLLVADTYVPARISGALQMRDLAIELARRGHHPVVLTPVTGPGPKVRLEQIDGVDVLRVRAPRTKDVPLIKRAIAEILLPWILLRGLSASSLCNARWEGIVWYSPTIFLGPLVARLKRRHRCKAYLILRDLFPDWAVDAGVMRKGLAYRFFKAVERHQYRQADVIGVQTPSNMALVARDAPDGARIEVLHNWLAAPVATDDSSVMPSLRPFDGRTVFVYAGNMGVAQDMDAFVDLARRMQDRADVGFLFIGRGSEVPRLKAELKDSGLKNLLIQDEIDSSLLPGVLSRCHVGIIALHPAHGTHNIPGKLVTYLLAGLPVIARVNPNNDLVGVIENEYVGLVVAGDNPSLLHAHANRLADDPALRKRMGEAGIVLAERMFSPASAGAQIIAGLTLPNA